MINKMNIAKNVVELLKLRKQKIATVESCTGGKIADEIVSVSGASSVFEYGYITYSNEAKQKLVKVSKDILQTFGAISEQTAKAMAMGAAKVSGANIGISSTGVAGPAMDENKPVGLVYIGCYYMERSFVKKCFFEGDRENIRNQAAIAAMEFTYEVMSRNGESNACC